MFNPSKKITKKDIQELYYITDIENVPSILDKGILSHNTVKDIPHVDISNKEIQGVRENKLVPLNTTGNKLPLWSFVCLFAQPHNAMMYVSRHKHICVIRLDKNILEQDDVIITDRNASCQNATFAKASDWVLTNETARCLYSRQSLPTMTNQITHHDYKSIRQLEILCPQKVAQKYILGFFVKQKEHMEKVLKMVTNKLLSLSVIINDNIFFLGKTTKLKTFMPLTFNAINDDIKDNQPVTEESEDCTIVDEIITLSL